MTVSTKFPFDTPGNYTFDSNKIEIVGGFAKLKIGAGSTLNKISPFDTPGNYTFDSNKIEVTTGLARLKRLPPATTTFFASFDTSVNASWGDGSIVGTPVGGPAITSNRLDLTGGTVKYVDFNAASNASSQQVGAIRLDVIPNYTGAPAAIRRFICISQASGSLNNRILIEHRNTGGGQLWIYLNDQAGASLVSVNLGTWTPTSGQSYEFELNWDLTTGATRLFIDGVQFGATQTGTGTRSSSIGLLRVGSGEAGTTSADFSIDNLVYFTTVQHTAGYTSPSAAQSATKHPVDNPNIDLTTHKISEGAGKLYSIQQFLQTVSISGSDAIKYQLSTDDGTTWQYFNGSIWTSGSGYAQSNTLAELNSNIGTLDISAGNLMVRAFLHSDNGNTTPSLDTFQVDYKRNEYPQDNPTLLTQPLAMEKLVSFSEVVQKAGNDNVKYQVVVAGVPKYWTGSAWDTASLGYTHSNTAAEISTNALSLLTLVQAYSVAFLIFIHSDTGGNTTPSLDEITTYYNLHVPVIPPPDRCVVTGQFQNSLGQPEEGVEVIAVIDGPAEVDLKNIRVPNIPVFTTTDNQGRWQLDLVRSAEYDPDRDYILKFKKRDFEATHTVTVPSASTANINDLI